MITMDRRSLIIGRLPGMVRWQLVLTRLVLLTEQLMGAFLPLFCVVGVGLAVALSGQLARLPAWAHMAGLCLLVLALGWSLYDGVRRVRWPTQRACFDRLDQSVPHRPLTALADGLPGQQGQSEPTSHSGPAAGSPEFQTASLTETLWNAHRARMMRALRALRVAPPRPILPVRDPWGLRVLPVLALVVVAPLVDGDSGYRLWSFWHPAWGGAARGVATADLWITPPPYTGLAPLHRTSVQPPSQPAAPLGRMQVVEGSTLVVIVHGAADPAVKLGAHTWHPRALGAGEQTGGTDHRLDLRLAPTDGDRTLIVEGEGREIARWPMTVQEDAPPRVAFSAPITGGPDGRLRLPVDARDDFGVVGLTVDLTRADGETRTVPLPVTQGGSLGESAVVVGPREIARVMPLDLASDPWAGQQVSLRMTARDAAGSASMTAPVEVRLPERAFQHPVARRLAKVRRMLMDDPEGARASAIVDLTEVAQAPAAFNDVPVVFLGVRVGALRLSDPKAAIVPVTDLLWSLAVRIEDGVRGDADQQLADAQQALEDAIARNAPASEIAEKVEALRRAVHAYMRTLLQSMPDLAKMAEMGLDQMAQPEDGAISTDSLDEMLQQLRDLEALGARDAAEALRRKIADMLTALREAQPPDPAAMQQMMQSMKALQDLTDRQKALLDETFQASREDSRSFGKTGQMENRDQVLKSLETRQEALRRQLNGLAGLGSLPPALQEADDQMHQAVGSLSRQALSPATRAQGEALEALQSGSQQMVRQMMQAMGRGQSNPMLIPGGGKVGRGPYDPLSGSGFGGGDETVIPTKADTSRAHDIQQELRRRANDADRSEGERDYIRRLLRQF